MQRWNDTILIRKVNGDVMVGAGATITVYDAGTVTPSTIYSDNGVTAQVNPFAADTEGKYSFYAADGRYDINISGTGIVTYTLHDIVLDDPITPDDLRYTPVAATTPANFTADSYITIKDGSGTDYYVPCRTTTW